MHTVKKMLHEPHAMNHTNLNVIWCISPSKCTESCDFTWDLNDYVQFELSIKQVYDL